MDKNLIPYADWHDDETDLDHAQEIARKSLLHSVFRPYDCDRSK